MGGFMRIKRLIGGELMANGYIISDRSGGECYIIDPGYDYKYYVDYINKENLKLKGILLRIIITTIPARWAISKKCLMCPYVFTAGI